MLITYFGYVIVHFLFQGQISNEIVHSFTQSDKLFLRHER